MKEVWFAGIRGNFCNKGEKIVGLNVRRFDTRTCTNQPIHSGFNLQSDHAVLFPDIISG